MPDSPTRSASSTAKPAGVQAPSRRPSRRRSVQIAILCLAAFAASAAVAFGVFDALPHLEDEHANLFQAAVFARGEIVAPAPPSKDSFFIPFTIVQNGIWFGKYTPGFPLVLALGVLAGAPWLVNALASALALLGTFLLGRDLFDADSGLLAAALGAVSPAFIILSGSLLPHPVTMAALVFFAWAFLRARRPGQARAGLYSLLAGSALGLAVLCRPWTALAIALPFICLAAVDALRAAGGMLRRVGDGKQGRNMENGGKGRSALRPYEFVRAYLPLVISCLALCALLPLFNWAVTGSPLTNTYTLWWPYDTVGFGPAVGRDEGHTLLLGLLNARLDLVAFQTAFTGWPAPLGVPLAAMPLILGLLDAPRSRKDLLLLLPPLALVVFHLAYWARAGPFYGGRYYAEGMPFLWLLAARGILKFSAGKWRLLSLRLALPVLLAWGIVFQIQPRFLEGRGLYGITREGPNAVAAAGLQNALVFIRVRKWTDYANFAALNSPFLDGGVVFARDMGGDVNAAILAAFPGRKAYYYDGRRIGPRLIEYGLPPP
jgi:hypothetical protein